MENRRSNCKITRIYFCMKKTTRSWQIPVLVRPSSFNTSQTFIVIIAFRVDVKAFSSPTKKVANSVLLLLTTLVEVYGFFKRISVLKIIRALRGCLNLIPTEAKGSCPRKST